MRVRKLRYRDPTGRKEGQLILHVLLGTEPVVRAWMARNQALDRLVGDFANLVEISLAAGGAPVGHRVGGDHAGRGDTNIA